MIRKHYSGEKLYCDKFIEDNCQRHTVCYGEAAAVSYVKPSQHHLATSVTLIHLELCWLPSSGDGKWLLLRIHGSIRLNSISQASNRPNILVTSPIARIFLVTSPFARIFSSHESSRPYMFNHESSPPDVLVTYDLLRKSCKQDWS